MLFLVYLGGISNIAIFCNIRGFHLHFFTYVILFYVSFQISKTFQHSCLKVWNDLQMVGQKCQQL